MLVYRLYKRTYSTEPLSAEGARRAGGRWNPKGFGILYTSATPELALLEVMVHLNPTFVPDFNLLVLAIPESAKIVSLTDLPANWRSDELAEPMQTHLSDWLSRPDVLMVSVPSSVVVRSRNYLLHPLHPTFGTQVKIIENEPFEFDFRLVKRPD